MMWISGTDSPSNYQRPAPVFISGERPLSTKKSRGSPKFAPPPRAPVKSCPVTRIFSKISDSDRDRPQPVSFREDSDTSFIVHSPVYSAAKPALYFEQCYDIEERLGIGSFGEVFKVRSKEDGKLYACKRTLLRFRGEGDRRRRMEEVQKHEKLPKHSNCVEFYRAWEERQHLYLLTEVCHTSLANMADDRHDLPESVVWDYLVDLLQGVRHLHKHDLVHMDIKPENIFFGFDGLCKLGDFGLVIDVSQEGDREALEGDPKYLAPEILELKFGPPADLFSLGMTILELATDLDLPKQGDSWQQLRQGLLPPAASHLSKDLQLVLLGLLHPNPSERMTAEEALALAPIKHVLFYKTFRDHWRKLIMKTKMVVTQAWLYITIVLMFLSRHFKALRRRQLSGDSPNNSKMSDSDFMMGFSDEEGLDDHSLAQPLCDISSSSSEATHYHTRPFGNSTPIGNHLKHRKEIIINNSPIARNNFDSSPKVDDTPSFIRRRGTPRSGKPYSTQGNESTASSFNDTPSPKRVIAIDEEPLQSMNLTSRNLIDLFNAAESDDD